MKSNLKKACVSPSWKKNDEYQFFNAKKGSQQKKQKKQKPTIPVQQCKSRSQSKDSYDLKKCVKTKRRMSQYKKTERTRSCSNGIKDIQSSYKLKTMEKTSDMDEVYNRCKTIIETYQVKYEQVLKDNARLHSLNENLQSQNKKLKGKN